MADVATNDTPNIETVAKRTRRYIQYNIDAKEREIAMAQAHINALRTALDLVESAGDEIKGQWDRQKKVDTPPVA
jgi:hypothetical protein